jgi:hypothetical protein
MDLELLAVLLGTDQELWHVETDNLTVRLRASTSQSFTDPDTAWVAAKQLRDAITGLGHEIYGTCQVGVVSDYEMRGSTGTTVSMPNHGQHADHRLARPDRAVVRHPTRISQDPLHARFLRPAEP